MTHVPLNAHPKATGPDTNPLESTASDDEFLPMVEIAEGTFVPDRKPWHPGHMWAKRTKVRRS